MKTNPIVVAHSLSASVTLETVMRAPDQSAGLVIDPGAVGLNVHETGPDKLPFFATSQYVRRAGVALTSTNPLMTENLIRSFIYDKTLDVSKYAAVLQQPTNRKGTTTARAEWIVDLLVPPNDALSTREPEIAKFTLPTTLIWGAKDEVAPFEVGQTLNQLIAGSTFDVIPNIGHIPQIEHSGLFHKHLSRRYRRFRVARIKPIHYLCEKHKGRAHANHSLHMEHQLCSFARTHCSTTVKR